MDEDEDRGHDQVDDLEQDHHQGHAGGDLHRRTIAPTRAISAPVTTCRRIDVEVVIEDRADEVHPNRRQLPRSR